MSLLIEPANAEACKRNVKEQKLQQGKFYVKSREEYMMEHIGFPAKFAAARPPATPAGSSAASALRAAAAKRRRQPSESGLASGRVTPLRAAAHGLGGRSASQPNLGMRPQQRTYSQIGSERPGSPAESMRSFRPSTSYSLAAQSVADSCASTEIDEVDLAYQQIVSKDPVLEMMMKGPPLFSAPLCNMAATRAYAGR
eukprot:TRINITY_DN125095_c0_g1_i1.p2 TRINITY_DN125095_c0_g1~~TRINITY_DN125095_c0_g1_i1.p2  ORF type:complete len:198 (-),score=36.00 TRINITY_DN125095_c0_g1_i1:223-816(-)